MESKKEENENEDEDDYENEYENEDYDEAMDQNKKNKIIKEKNDILDKIIDNSKSFEDQIKLIRKVKNLNECYDMHNYDDKELKLKFLKQNLKICQILLTKSYLKKYLAINL